jgi:hypothetical protein
MRATLSEPGVKWDGFPRTTREGVSVRCDGLARVQLAVLLLSEPECHQPRPQLGLGNYLDATRGRVSVCWDWHCRVGLRSLYLLTRRIPKANAGDGENDGIAKAVTRPVALMVSLAYTNGERDEEGESADPDENKVHSSPF